MQLTARIEDGSYHCCVAKRGPKPKPPEERADRRLSVALTKAQKELIEKAAEQRGVSTSKFIAQAATARAQSVVKKKSRR